MLSMMKGCSLGIVSTKHLLCSALQQYSTGSSRGISTSAARKRAVAQTEAGGLEKGDEQGGIRVEPILEKRLLLIDGHHLAYRTHFALA